MLRGLHVDGMCYNREMTVVGRVWVIALGYWLVLSVICILWCPATAADMTFRYAPMADAFARGDWQYAFHPRFGVLFMAFSGSIGWLTGLNGIHSCQVAAIGFLALSAVPVWCLVARLFDERAAWVAVAMTLCSIEVFVYAIDGLRDTGRTLGMALCAFAFVCNRSWVMALGLLVLSTLRTDLMSVSGVLLGVWWLWKLYRREWRSLVLPTIAWALGIFLMCALNHAYTGSWLPVGKMVKMYEQQGRHEAVWEEGK